jgi:hypothetical protein
MRAAARAGTDRRSGERITMTAGTPVVFIHGLWLHATSWQPWADLFRESGYDPIAPGWPGEPGTVEESRKQTELVVNLGIYEVTDHYA